MISKLNKAVEDFQTLINNLDDGTCTEYWLETYPKKGYDSLSAIQECLKEFHKCETSNDEKFTLQQQEFDFLVQNETYVNLIEDWQDDMRKWLRNFTVGHFSNSKYDNSFSDDSIENIILEILCLKVNTVSTFQSKILQTNTFRYWGYLDYLDYLIETDKLIIHLHLSCSD